MRYVSVADTYPAERLIPIGVALPYRASQRFKERGIEYLEDLTQYRYEELLWMPDVGETNANLIEAAMAKHGVLLRDGEPAQVRDAPPAEPEPVGRRIEGSASAVRKAYAKTLFKSGEHLLKEATVLMKAGARVLGGSKVASVMERTINVRIQAHHEALRVIEPLRTIEDGGKVKRKPPRPVARVAKAAIRRTPPPTDAVPWRPSGGHSVNDLARMSKSNTRH